MAELVEGCTAFEDETDDSEDRSAAASTLATASLDQKKRSFNSSSVCALLSTMVGLGHSAAMGDAAAVAVAAAVSAGVEDVVANCPPAIFFMAELKRPTGRNQWPLLAFSIRRWAWLPF